MAPPPPSVLVLGGGVTGLNAARLLRRAGAAVTLLEAAERTGGAVVTYRDGDYTVEGGPNTLLCREAEIFDALHAVGLGDRIIPAAPAARNRYLLRDGRIRAAPLGPASLLTTPLLSWPAKLRVLREPFIRRAPSDTDESLAAFVRRRLGPEFLDYFINPFVGGVYAGDPEKLSVRHAFPRLHGLEANHGSLIRGGLAFLFRKPAHPRDRGKRISFSFPGGLGDLVAALTNALTAANPASPPAQLKLRSRLTSLTRDSDHRWQAAWTSPVGNDQSGFDAVLCAVPAYAIPQLPLPVTLATALAPTGEIHYPPLTSLSLGFRREQVAHPLDGFGVLFAEIEKTFCLGCLFVSSLFPGRAPPGHVLLTTFAGGSRNPNAATLDDAALLDGVLGDLATYLGVKGRPAFHRFTRWPRAVPQYTVGYAETLAALDRAEAAHPGFFLGGHYRDGISLGQCLLAGGRLARRTAAHLGRPTPEDPPVQP